MDREQISLLTRTHILDSTSLENQTDSVNINGRMAAHILENSKMG